MTELVGPQNAASQPLAINDKDQALGTSYSPSIGPRPDHSRLLLHLRPIERSTLRTNRLIPNREPALRVEGLCACHAFPPLAPVKHGPAARTTVASPPGCADDHREQHAGVVGASCSATITALGAGPLVSGRYRPYAVSRRRRRTTMVGTGVGMVEGGCRTALGSNRQGTRAGGAALPTTNVDAISGDGQDAGNRSLPCRYPHNRRVGRRVRARA